MKTREAVVTITLSGDLPEKAFKESQKRRLEERIKEDVEDILGEYEIWGEFFGEDPEVYALFLRGVEINVENS